MVRTIKVVMILVMTSHITPWFSCTPNKDTSIVRTMCYYDFTYNSMVLIYTKPGYRHGQNNGGRHVSHQEFTYITALFYSQIYQRRTQAL